MKATVKATKSANYTKSEVMKNAWRLFKSGNKEVSFSECLKLAWYKAKNKPTLNINAIYNEYYKRILFYVNGNVKQLDISEEITNDVFLKANDNLHKFDSEIGKLNTWLYNIAKNVVIDYFRANNRRLTNTTNIENYVSEEGEVFFTTTDNHIASELIENKEVNDKIMNAINKLTDKYKEIAILHIIEERTYEEIAEMLDISMSNTKVLIHRTKEKLQSELKHEYSLL